MVDALSVLSTQNSLMVFVGVERMELLRSTCPALGRGSVDDKVASAQGISLWDAAVWSAD